MKLRAGKGFSLEELKVKWMCVLCCKRADYLASKKAALKIIESYMEGYRQYWKLSFEKDTVIRGNKEELLLLVLEKVTSHIFTRLVLNYSASVVIEIFAHTLQEKHVKLFLYQDGSVLDSDMFDMWGDKDEEKKVKKVHIIALHILFMLKMLL
ncbi:hypothetical protein P8452_55929 [Trifolium repens]|nr:hypothetical protein P8452_55929 [Trifolium repens]